MGKAWHERPQSLLLVILCFNGWSHLKGCYVWCFSVESAPLLVVRPDKGLSMSNRTELGIRRKPTIKVFRGSDAASCRPMSRSTGFILEHVMYAVFKSGGKQHRVVEGETLKLEKIEVATGETIDFDEVLMVANGEDIKIGAPIVDGAKVTAEVISHGRGEKVKIIKFRRRKHSMKRQGHRQWYTEVKITGIKG